jgi:hypothetical protein
MNCRAFTGHCGRLGQSLEPGFTAELIKLSSCALMIGAQAKSPAPVNFRQGKSDVRFFR